MVKADKALRKGKLPDLKLEDFGPYRKGEFQL
jgi:hypothetical protein